MFRFAPLIITVLASLATAQTTSPAVKLTVAATQPLGQTNRQSTMFKIVGSPDIQRVAMFVRESQKVNVMLDGQVVATHDWVLPGGAGFSPDHKHFVYIAQDGTEMFVVMNGQRRKSYYEVLPPVQMSVDGAHLLYVARPKGGKPCVVFDEKEGAPFDSIGSLAITGTANRYCYVARRDGVTYLVDGTTEIKLDAGPADRVEVRLTPDGKHLKVVYAVGRKVYFRIDGDTFGPYEDVRDVPATAADGSTWAVTVKIDGRWSVIENGKVIDTAESIGRCAYAEKPNRLTYTRREGATESFMVAGKPLATVPVAIGFAYATFSPDYQRFAYPSARGEDKQFVVVDGKEGPSFRRILPPIFSDDSKRVAYFATESPTDLVVMVDGTPLALREGVIEVGMSTPMFSPNGRHVAYLAGDGKTPQHLYVDNVRGPEVPNHPAPGLVRFVDDQTLRVIVTAPDYRVTAYTIKIEASN